MDANTIVGILTGIGILGGSLGTIIITKIIDYFSEKRTFKRELKRQFFAKKLEAAEKATKFYNSGNNYYAMLQYGLWLFVNEGNMYASSALTVDASKKCKELWDDSMEQVSVISLYFDIKPMKDYPVNNEDKLVALLSNYTDKDIEATKINSQLKEARLNNDENLISKHQEDYTKVENEAKEICKELIQCIENEKNRNAYFTKSIREELKKYDM